MEDLQTARAAMEQKTQRKRELINQLKGMNAKLMELREALNKAQPSAPVRRTPTQRLIEKAEHMEFVIGTSAYTPAQERAMLKELKLVQAQIGQAAAVNKASDEVQNLRTSLREQLALRAPVQVELDALRVELEALYQVILKAGAERAQQYAKREEFKARQGERESREGRRPSGERGAPSGPGGRGPRSGREGGRSFNDERRRARDEERAEMAPYMKEVDPYVSLEEIAEFKKKPASPSS